VESICILVVSATSKYSHRGRQVFVGNCVMSFYLKFRVCAFPNQIRGLGKLLGLDLNDSTGSVIRIFSFFMYTKGIQKKI